LSLPQVGGDDGQWGGYVNDGVTSLIDVAVAGRVSIDMTAGNVTLTVVNNATDQARNMILDLNGAPSVSVNVICPSSSKVYVVRNNCGQIATIKTASGSGVSIPNGKSAFVMCDGASVYDIVTNTLSLSISGDPVVSAASVQTLSNKTLVSPLLVTPTISNATLGTPISGNLANCTNIPVANAVGNLPIANLAGGVSASSTTFWCGNGTWATPAGGGGGGGGGTVTSVSVASANGFAGVVSNPNLNAAITLTTNLTGLLKGNGTAMLVATAGTDYVIPNGNIGSPQITYTINGQTTSYTLVLLDASSRLITISSSSITTLTIPLNATVAFPVGTAIDVIQTGSAQVTIAGISGVSVNGTPGLKLRAQYSSASLIKIGTDSWVVVGDLSA
jgi:hypothetical protein